MRITGNGFLALTGRFFLGCFHQHLTAINRIYTARAQPFPHRVLADGLSQRHHLSFNDDVTAAGKSQRVQIVALFRKAAQLLHEFFKSYRCFRAVCSNRCFQFLFPSLGNGALIVPVCQCRTVEHCHGLLMKPGWKLTGKNIQPIHPPRVWRWRFRLPLRIKSRAHQVSHNAPAALGHVLHHRRQLRQTGFLQGRRHVVKIRDVELFAGVMPLGTVDMPFQGFGGFETPLPRCFCRWEFSFRTRDGSPDAH
ncbi:MAG: hypothetical protein NTY01_10155 [Verrucomicrobia bacterium]|nr:hypothetical protein [Verrucomicrobiota bacterium]